MSFPDRGFGESFDPASLLERSEEAVKKLAGCKDQQQWLKGIEK